MENEEIKDSGIIGYSELEEVEGLKEQLEERNQRIADLEEEINDLESDLSDANSEVDELQQRIIELQEDFDEDYIKSNVMTAIATRLTIDGMLTPELEAWLENFGRFYLDEV